MMSVADILQVQTTVVIRLRSIFVVLAIFQAVVQLSFHPFFPAPSEKPRPRGVSFAVPFSGDIACCPRNPFSLLLERLPRRLLAISCTTEFI